jgi:hypothetical protein
VLAEPAALVQPAGNLHGKISCATAGCSLYGWGVQGYVQLLSQATCTDHWQPTGQEHEHGSTRVHWFRRATFKQPMVSCTSKCNVGALLRIAALHNYTRTRAMRIAPHCHNTPRCLPQTCLCGTRTQPTGSLHNTKTAKLPHNPLQTTHSCACTLQSVP